jgi:hypothetical protein
VALLNTLFGCYSKSALLREACPVSDFNGTQTSDSGTAKTKKMRRA